MAIPIASCKCDIRITKAESSESGHVDVLAELRRVADYQLRDGDGIVFDEGLVVKADLSRGCAAFRPVLLGRLLG